MTLSNYLTKRPGSSYWQLRVPVPRSVQKAFGRAEVTRSLRTSDRAAATRLALPIIAELRARWDALTGEVSPPSRDDERSQHRMPTFVDLEDLAAAWGYDRLLEFHKTRTRELCGASDAEWTAHVEQHRQKLSRRVREVATGDISRFADSARKILTREGWEVEEGSKTFRDFCGMLAHASLDAMQTTKSCHEGNLAAEPTSDLVRRAQSRRTKTAPPGQSIAELFEGYAKQRRIEGRKREDTISQDRKVIAFFAEFVGRTRAINTITRTDARDFRDTVAKLPPNFRKRKTYAALSLRDAAQLAQKNGERPISATTLNKYVSTVSPYFDWLLENGYTEHNPFDGLHFRLPKGKNPRPPFTTEQLNAILASPLFTGFLADGKEHLPGNRRADDWRYWIPLICLFTGARIGEVAQLRLEDIRREHDIWFVHIRDDKTTGQRTKSGYSRALPLHSKLVEIGLTKFHARQLALARKNGNHQLFPELTSNDRKQIGWQPSRFWRRYLQKIGLKAGPDGFGAHSFRHTIADQLRLAGYRNEEFGPLILGHSNKTVTSGYGQLREGNARMLKEMIEAMKFEGVQFGLLS